MTEALQPDPDAHLSDHEWRLKMAAEGKAIYIPGKTVEEVLDDRAAQAEARARKVSRPVTLSEEDWSGVDTALPDTLEMLTDLHYVLLTLSYLDDLDQPEVNATLRLAARAVRSFSQSEGAALDRLDFALRHAPKGGQP